MAEALTTLVLLDTDVLIDYLNGKDHARQHIELLTIQQCLVSDVTVMEIYAGCFNKQEYQVIEKTLRAFAVLHLTGTVSQEALKLVKQYCLSHSVDIPDMLNAALALEFGLTLFTYNVKDYKFIPSIMLYDSHRKA